MSIEDILNNTVFRDLPESMGSRSSVDNDSKIILQDFRLILHVVHRVDTLFFFFYFFIDAQHMDATKSKLEEI